MIPVTTPHAKPTPRPTRNTTGIGIPWWAWNMFAETYAERPTTEPTDRSTLRVITTNVSPIATSA